MATTGKSGWEKPKSGSTGETPLKLQVAPGKVDQIQQHLRMLVRVGQLRSGMRLPPERELAEQFGVSVPTVNKAMAGLATDQVVDRSPGRGTYISEDVSRGLVAVVFSSNLVSWPQGSPFYLALMQSLGAALTHEGFRPHFLLANGNGEEAAQSLHPDSVLWRHVVGVIAHSQLGSLADQLAERGVPLVGYSEPPGVQHVVLDDQASLGYLAGRHLVARGYGRIGLVRYVSHGPRCQVLDNFGKALDESGIELDVQSCVLDAQPGGGGDAFRRLWARQDRPEAVFVADDCLAVGFVREMRESGVKTPEGLAVITHATGGVPMEDLAGFTTCQFDVARTSRTLCALLDRLVCGARPAPAKTRLHPRVVQGKTT